MWPKGDRDAACRHTEVLVPPKVAHAVCEWRCRGGVAAGVKVVEIDGDISTGDVCTVENCAWGAEQHHHGTLVSTLRDICLDVGVGCKYD